MLVTKVTGRNVVKILELMASQADEDRYFADGYAVRLNALLDELNDQKFFGPEGQSDPRVAQP